MIKRIAALVAAFLLSAGLGLAIATPAQASGTPLHNCPWADVCIYKGSSYTGGQTNQTLVAILHASNSCWQFNSSWNNSINSWVANFDTPTKEVRLFDSTNCTGSYRYGGDGIAYEADMGSWDNKVGSIQLV